MTDNALALIEPKNAAQYFIPNGLDPVIEKIREQVAGIVPDISTKKGRDEIASLAYKVAKSKTALDDMGKQLVSGIKEQAKAIDAERRRAWDEIETIQKDVRAPLTEWENGEKERVAAHEAALAAIPESAAYGQTETAADLVVRLATLENLPPRDWQEFKARAEKALADEIERTKALLATAQQREAEQAELARLRQEEAARKQREHEERIAAEAAAKAKAEADEQARQAAEAEAARVRAEQEKAEQERQRLLRQTEEAEREKAEAEARARQAEDDRLAAESARRAAEERAERDRKAAVEAAAQAERDRLAAEQKAEAEALAKREADKKHRAKINNAALAGFIAVGLPEEAARMAVEAIARGEIPNVKITY